MKKEDIKEREMGVRHIMMLGGWEREREDRWWEKSSYAWRNKNILHDTLE